jgi:hypothetical protein
VPELREHPAHFAILPFSKDHLEDGGLAHPADYPNSPRSHLAFGQPDALNQLVEHFALGRTGDDDAIQLLDAELRVRQAIGQLAVVRQKHEARAHLVEAAHGVDPLGNLGKKIDDARTSRRVVVRRNVTLRLGDGEVHRPFRVDSLTVDFNPRVLGIDLGAQFADDLAIDADPPL